MNLVYKYPIIFWNCACLISDSGGIEDSEEENDIEEENCYEEYLDEFEDFSLDDDDEEDDDEKDKDVKKVKKKSIRNANYGKIAAAIGKMKMSGIDVAPPDINKSKYTFSPDPNLSIIRYGLSGITKVGTEVVQNIIKYRPYSSIDDFLLKVKINKPQMINLIKAGAFDSFGDRVEIMHQYIDKISDVKKRITLQNMKMLIDFELIPDEYDLERRIYNFNKYIKKSKWNNYYSFDNPSFSFYEEYFDLDKLEPSEISESGFMIKQTVWDKIYQSYMDNIRAFIQKNGKKLLVSVNERLTHDVWDKYCLGTISKWEMDSVSFYSHPHELEKMDFARYDCSNFFEMPENPEADRIISIKGAQIPLLKIKRIAGTVLDKDKTKKMVTLLTKEGVVTVKIYGEVFSNYDKQISERGENGKKHVLRKSEFSRGNKIIICGVRSGDNFVAKKYSKTPYPLIETIEDVFEDGSIRTFNRSTDI